MWQIPYILTFICVAVCVQRGAALYCYQCDSSQAGCGEWLDIRLQHWKQCAGEKTGEMCVKITEKVGTRKKITRGCMSTILVSTFYRLDMPVRRRHNYCDPGRNIKNAEELSDGRGDLVADDSNRLYCFCNDWSGCNGSSGIHTSATLALALASIVIAVIQILQ